MANGQSTGPAGGPAHPGAQTARWMRWALGLSLGMNLLVIGAVAGAALRFGGHDRNEGPNLRAYGTPYIVALPPDQRREIFRQLRSETGGRGMSRRARRAMYDQIVVALRADPFDPVAVTDVLDAQRRAALGVQDAGQAAWLAKITHMDRAARAAYADRLQQVLERGPRRARERHDETEREDD